MKRILIIALTLLALVGACGIVSPEPTPEPTPEQVAAAAAKESAIEKLKALGLNDAEIASIKGI